MAASNEYHSCRPINSDQPMLIGATANSVDPLSLEKRLSFCSFAGYHGLRRRSERACERRREADVVMVHNVSSVAGIVPAGRCPFTKTLTA